MLEHGGLLRQAAAHYGIALPDWLDLSTGINPHAWPVPTPSAASWQRLPEDDDGLVETARCYYGVRDLLPVAGSQAAIQALPRLRERGRVGVLQGAYAEHALRWRMAGHELRVLQAGDLRPDLPELDVLVLCSPDNPTGTQWTRAQLLRWQTTLAARGGWLVVDEAFIDARPEQSVASDTGRDGLIVLRSLGKFFGLAGARVGFVCAAPALLQRLAEMLGPWPIAGPAREIAQHALADRAWQAGARATLAQQSARLAALLDQHGLAPAGGCALFQWVRTARAAAIHDELARQAILTRLFDAPASLRFGLPGREADWARLDAALRSVTRKERAA
ncbi:MAG: threonine-phosphate decarboxylase CobD [Pseudomonadota bacterium]